MDENVKDGMIFFFFQAEDGIRDAQESRGLGDVYKRQVNIYYGAYFISLTIDLNEVLLK
ncbi:hypothetical protein CDFC105_31832 [Clostridioides difficile]|nr:hypothetical protein CDFC105_31832 [Clostridioides difficile]